MWILNICIFASTSENGALILYFKKIILKIQKKPNKQTNKKLKHCKYFSIFCKNVMSKQRLTLFSLTPPFLEKIFHPTLIGKLEEVHSPFINGGGGEGVSNYVNTRWELIPQSNRMEPKAKNHSLLTLEN